MKNSLVQLSLVGILLSQLACSNEGMSSGEGEGNMSLTSQASSSDQGKMDAQKNGRKNFTINLDVGKLQLRYAPIKSDYEVSWTKGESCDRIEVKEDEGALNIRHSDNDQSCGGSQIKLVLRNSMSVAVKSGAGAIIVEDADRMISKLSSLKGQVMAGNITSEVGAINVKRQWSQVYADYSGNSENGTELSISLSAGQITFQK